MGGYRDINTGRGQANLGRGNRNIGRDHIERRVHNQGLYAERDVHYRQGDYYDIQQGDPDPLFEGKGVGRVIGALGGLVALAGFGAWMYVIFQGFASTDTSFNPMSLTVGGVPVMVAGIVAFIVGGVVGGLGGAMALAARRRHNRAQYYRRRPF